MTMTGRNTQYLRRAANGLFWIAVAVLAANLGRKVMTPATESMPTIVPYTVATEMRLVKPDGSSDQPMLTVWALRSDGSRASRIATTNVSQRYVALASGREQYILEQLGKKSTVFDPDRVKPERWLRYPAANCVAAPDESFAGAEKLSGYRVAKIVSRSGPVIFFALDYGCAPLGSSADWGSQGRNETRLVSLVLGEPPLELFADPPTFPEVPPSALFPQRGTRGDAYYASHRP